MEAVQHAQVAQSSSLKVQFVSTVDLGAPTTLFQELASDHQLLNAPKVHSSTSLLSNANVHLINPSAMVSLVFHVIFLFTGIGIIIIVQAVPLVNISTLQSIHALDAQLGIHLIFLVISVYRLSMYAKSLVSTLIQIPINAYVLAMLPISMGQNVQLAVHQIIGMPSPRHV
jgi:hypothetical protein